MNGKNTTQKARLLHFLKKLCSFIPRVALPQFVSERSTEDTNNNNKQQVREIKMHLSIVLTLCARVILDRDEPACLDDPACLCVGGSEVR